MNIYNTYQKIENTFKCRVYNEDFNSLELKSSLLIPLFKDTLQSVSLEDIFKTFDNSLTLTILNQKTNVSNSYKIGDTTNTVLSDLEWMFSTKNDEEAEITIRINKRKLNNIIKTALFRNSSLDVKICSFFNEDYAVSFFKMPLKDIENLLFDENFNKFLFYLPYLDIPSSKNKYSLLFGRHIDFSPKENMAWYIQDIDIEKDIKKLNEDRNIHCNWIDSTRILHASMFWYEKPFSNKVDIAKLNNSVLIPYINLFLFSIFNYTSNNQLKLIGHKTLDLSLNELNYKEITSKSLITSNKLFEFIYSSNIQDKLALTRNTLSFNLSNKDTINNLLSELPPSYNSIQNSFNIYIGEKLDKFFDKKLELEKHARDTAKDISDEITNSINLISRNLLTLIGTALVTFIARGVNGSEKIMWAATIFYICYVFITTLMFSYFSINKKNHAYDNFDHYIKLNNYVDESTKEHFKTNIVDRRVTLFRTFWWGSIISSSIFIILIIILANTIF